ncbi:MAG: methyltransferase domain-containing protein [Acidimicrobiales bacterium]
MVNSDAVVLPFPDHVFDAVLAPHMLYHVVDRHAAAHELRRVLAPGGTCVAVTNGAGSIAARHMLGENAAGASSPGWKMVSWAMEAFSLENGADQLRNSFSTVACVRPAQQVRVVLRDATVAAGYVESLADHYQDEIDRPWAEIAAEVRRQVQAVIDRDGAFVTNGDVGAFVCR